MRKMVLLECLEGTVCRLRFVGCVEWKRAIYEAMLDQNNGRKTGRDMEREKERGGKDLHHRNLDRLDIFSIQTVDRLRSRIPESCI